MLNFVFVKCVNVIDNKGKTDGSKRQKSITTVMQTKIGLENTNFDNSKIK